MATEPLKKLVPEFVKNLTEKKRSPSTILAYKTDLEQLVEFLNGKNKSLPTQVSQTDLEEFRDSLLAQKYTPKSVSRKLNAVKTFFRWLLDDHRHDTDPSKDVAHPKIEPSQPKFLSQLEYRALRDVVRADPRIAAIVELILQTGMRISEVANLKIEHVEENEIIVDAYATQPQRRVPLNPAVRQALENYLNAHRPKSDHPHVFVSKTGKPLAVRNIRAAIDRFMQKAEIPDYSVNDLRTTFIVENLRRGVDLVTISQVAGHKRLSTTEYYLDLAGVNEPGKKQKLEEL
ncbi:tyrosine-type recombinase/integrase [Candidatus Woesebacteria bacterium]|nr:tyrosine-type recombinase/integrase [Candidatus Woesebacteria bacterium]